ncbi:MAG: hypothetical protein PF795_01775 [Kiritimatiellae bacterium]|jgi:hypothetical protein|nr:hypothetical protein [Kiritimatiellia bacterium]
MSSLIPIIRKVVPRSLRYAIQRHLNLSGFKARQRALSDPLSSVERSDPSVDAASDVPPIGILRNRAQYHTQYISACRELGLSFRVIDLGREDWIDAVRDSGCAVFMAWPDATQSLWAKLFKDRCRVMEEQMGLTVYPSSRDMWMYEEKVRTRDWLMANGFPHPRTWIFTRKTEALDFVKSCDLPIVFKTGFGAAAAGVAIVKSRSQLRRIVRRAFASGHVPGGHDRRDREWGRILLQEYLPDVREWRMVRIGDSYFGHPKGKLGEFHSGSGKAEWDLPSEKLLNLLYEVTERGGFRSMDVDIFETPEGELYINELQTVFGASVSIDQMKKDGVAGRMVRREALWSAEACCRLSGAGTCHGGGEENVEPFDSAQDRHRTSNVQRRSEDEARGSRSAELRIGRGEGGEEENANVERRTSNFERQTERGLLSDVGLPKSDSSPWIFEPGDFARNACCNLRIKDALSRFAQDKG